MRSTLIFTLILSVCYCDVLPRVKVMTDIINMTYHHYHKGCIVLIHSREKGMKEDLFIRDVTRMLHNAFFQTKVISMEKLVHLSVTSMCESLSPILVFLSNGIKVLQYLMELSLTSSLRGPAWLLFLDSRYKLEENLTDIIVPFDCKFLVIQNVSYDYYTITEVYKISPNSSLKTYPYGSWSMTHGPAWSALHMYERRNHLDGVAVKLGAVELNLYNKSCSASVLWEGMRYFCGLWTTLAPVVNISGIWQAKSDYVWGRCKNGTCNGLVEYVRAGHVEIGVEGFDYLRERYDAVDYSIPLYTDRLEILVKCPEESGIYWKNFLLPFSTGLWITLLLIILVISASFYFTNITSSRYITEYQQEQETIQESLFTILSAFCIQGCINIYKSHSCRLVLFTAHFTAVFVLATYSGSLISYLTTKTPSIPFDSLEGLLNDSSYRFLTVKGESTYAYFETSENPVLHQAFLRYLEPYEEFLPVSLEEGIRRICYSGKKYALFALSTGAKVAKDLYNCELTALPHDANTVTGGLIFKKGSWYRGIINYNLRKFRDGGILYRLGRPSISVKVSQSSDSAWMPVTVQNILPLILMLIFCAIITMLLLLFERYMANRSVHYMEE